MTVCKPEVILSFLKRLREKTTWIVCDKKHGADKTRKDEESLHENKKHELTLTTKARGLTNITNKLNVQCYNKSIP